MDLIDVREPFSTWSHAVGLAASLPASVFLYRRAGPSPSKRLGIVLYGLGLVACYLGSTAYHAVRGGPEHLDLFERLDHVGIHLLIAGTYTPLALTLLGGRWRLGTLGTVWGVTAVATSMLLLDRKLPSPLATCEYLALGWGAVFCCIELGRKLPASDIGWLVLGGVFYTAGALINVAGWPSPLPDLMDTHGYFHLWVLAGSAAHYQFMLRSVIPHDPAPLAGTAEAWPSVGPALLRTASPRHPRRRGASTLRWDGPQGRRRP